MTKETQLAILMDLAVDLGYEIRTDANIPVVSRMREILIDRSADAQANIDKISRILTGNPELAQYEIAQEQETALRRRAA